MMKGLNTFGSARIDMGMKKWKLIPTFWCTN